MSVNSRLEEAAVRCAGRDVRSGYLRRRWGQDEAVRFNVVAGRALFEGDIDLGHADGLSPALHAGAPAGAESEPERADSAETDAAGDPSGEEAAVVVADTSRLWREATVPIEPLGPSSPIAGIAIEAMNALSRATPVTFRPRTTADVDYVEFVPSAYCTSRVGRGNGRQVVRLSQDATAGNAAHELCHALGLWHEQSRADRDEHIAVEWQHILPGYEHNFRRQVENGDDSGPYDFDSITHYPPAAFSADGAPTLRALTGLAQFGQRNQLSAGDIAALCSLYEPGARRSPVADGTSAGGNDATGPANPKPDADLQIRPEPGLQFVVPVPARGLTRVLTRSWPLAWRVHWEVVPLLPGDAALGWQCAVRRRHEAGLDADVLDYAFTIENHGATEVSAAARYLVLERG